MSEPQLKCERCKTEIAAHHCESCQPFHDFCTKCDIAIHAFPSKANHGRIDVISPKTNDLTYQYTPNRQNCNRNTNKNNFQSMNNSQSTFDCNTSEYGLIYTREYVNELKRLFEKEKIEFQFKINSMQDNIDRLKTTFQAQMQKMQDEAMITFNKTKSKEEDYENKIKALLRDKNHTINQLMAENATVKSLNNDLNINLNKHSEQNREVSTTFNQQIEKLKSEIDTLNQVKSQLKQDSIDEVQTLINSNKEEIRHMSEKHQKEMNDKTYEHKYHQEQLRNEIEMNMKEIKELNGQNQDMRTMLDDMTKRNELVDRDNADLKEHCDKMSIDIKHLDERNEMLIRSLEKEKSDNNQMREDFEFFEKTINNLKTEITLLKDANYKIENDYNILMCQSEKMRKDFSDKLFRNDKLEERINSLIAENNMLRDQLKRNSIELTYEMK